MSLGWSFGKGTSIVRVVSRLGCGPMSQVQIKVNGIAGVLWQQMRVSFRETQVIRKLEIQGIGPDHHCFAERTLRHGLPFRNIKSHLVCAVFGEHGITWGA